MKAQVLASAVVAAALSCAAAEEGFTDLFDGKTLEGWKVQSGEAKYMVSNGCIRGECVMRIPFNTFLITRKLYENFVFRCEYLCEFGNSGLQFRSSTYHHKKKDHDFVFGYQHEITPNGLNCGRIYDEERRGFKGRFTWLDVGTPENVANEAAKTCSKPGEWNSLEIVCCGPHIRTFVNGKPVADILDDESQKGFIGLQIHAQMHLFTRAGVTWWRNIRIRELGGTAVWKDVAAKPAKGRIDGGECGDVMARATLPKGVPLSALVVRGIPWKAGRKEVFDRVLNADGPNEVSTIVYGDRVVHRLNGMEVYDGPLSCCGAPVAGRGRVEILSDNPRCRLRVCDISGLSARE